LILADVACSCLRHLNNHANALPLWRRAFTHLLVLLHPPDMHMQCNNPIELHTTIDLICIDVACSRLRLLNN
jgi:predicted transglutaminase-like protease